VLKDTRFQSLFTNPDMQIDVNHESFKNIAPLVSRLHKQNFVEDDDDGTSVRKNYKIFFFQYFLFLIQDGQCR